MKLIITIIATLATLLAIPAMAETVQFWYDQANGYYITGDYENAVASYDKAIELKPNSTVFWNYKGRSLANLGRFDEAILCFEKSIAFNSSDPEALNLKATAMSLGQKKYSESIVLFDMILESHPSYVDAWIGKGMALGNEGELTGAMQCFDRATEISPQNPSAWNNKGAIFMEQEKYQLALNCFNKALLFDPTNEAAMKNRENALQTMNQEVSSGPSQSTTTMD